ncbi:hypothetical protein [Pseudomonas mangrovi]|jgi:uncharacterized membrane protein|uniref:Glycerophosphoryl diester phosphodiesterase membrane domain-containing protein n=1 Tax=Pseudomonas mangrovi TaxID=2161748 RepID=A0A2T5P8H1_9PSED|nr:hypothetical protein [Pseudomonas mangrovi]PTU74042.1 hypothetical protein DBO85_11820 [Pseudomonas mangrovi]
MNIQQILRDSWFFYSRNILQIALLCGPLILLQAISAHLWEQSQGSKLEFGQSLLLGLLFSPLYQSVLIYFLAARSSGAVAGASQLFAAALRIWPAFVLLTCLTQIATVLGLFLLIAPGVWLAVKLSLAGYLLVLRQQQPIEAMRESFRLTTGHFWNIVILALASFVPLLVIAVLLFGLIPSENVEGLVGVALALPLGVVQLFSTVVLFRYFMLLETTDKPA